MICPKIKPLTMPTYSKGSESLKKYLTSDRYTIEATKIKEGSN
jgi:hypothetical protein